MGVELTDFFIMSDMKRPKLELDIKQEDSRLAEENEQLRLEIKKMEAKRISKLENINKKYAQLSQLKKENDNDRNNILPGLENEILVSQEKNRAKEMIVNNEKVANESEE